MFECCQAATRLHATRLPAYGEGEEADAVDEAAAGADGAAAAAAAAARPAKGPGGAALVRQLKEEAAAAGFVVEPARVHAISNPARLFESRTPV